LTAWSISGFEQEMTFYQSAVAWISFAEEMRDCFESGIGGKTPIPNQKNASKSIARLYVAHVLQRRYASYIHLSFLHVDLSPETRKQNLCENI
jgi:hypothetical protein